MSDQARIYDIFMREAALTMEPVLEISASNSALPGPSAISFPQEMRKRGDNEIFRGDFVFIGESSQAKMAIFPAKENLFLAGNSFRRKFVIFRTIQINCQAGIFEGKFQ